MTRLSAIVSLAAIVLNASAASAQPSLGSASGFAALAGGDTTTGVTCSNSTVTGDVGVVLSPPGFTNTNCTITGTVHAGDGVAATAYANFLSAYNNLAPLNNTCDLAHTLTGTLASRVLSPGVYCVNAVAKTGLLTLNGNANAVWIFLVDGALTGTNFNVVMMNGGQPCNVYWWVAEAATLTTSFFKGTILAGADITSTGSILKGAALAGGAGSTFFPTGAVTLTGSAVSVCSSGGSFPPVDKCEVDDDDDDDGDHHDNDGHDHDKDKDHHDKDKGKDNDKDHRDNDRKDKDHESKGKKRG